MAFSAFAIYAQSDLMYESSNNNWDRKEKTKLRYELLSKVESTNRRNLDTFYNTIFNTPKKLRFELGFNYGFALGGKYNYETYKSGLKLEAKDVEKKPGVSYGLKLNLYWPLVKMLYLQTGLAFGAEKFKVNTINSNGVETDENMETNFLCGNLGLMYNKNKLVIQNYLQIGQVLSPVSSFFGNVTSLGFRSYNSMFSINYRYSGGTLIEVTQKSETSEQERSYKADAIFFSYSYLGAFLSRKEKETLLKIKAQYKSDRLLAIKGKTPDFINQTLISPKNYLESTKASNYKDLSDSTLNDLLQLALKKEEFEKADIIQQEIKERIQKNKYAKTSDEDLKKLLDEAIKNEDYTTAQIIQLELDKRVALKKDTKGKTNQTNTPTKKTLKELEEDLKKAMEAEDYKKADEIQKEINKLK